MAQARDNWEEEELLDLSEGEDEVEQEAGAIFQLDNDDEDGPPQLFPEIPADEIGIDSLEDGDDDGEDEMPVLEREAPLLPGEAPGAPQQQIDVYRGNDGTVWTTELPNQARRIPAVNMVHNEDGRSRNLPQGASISDIFCLLLDNDILNMIVRHTNDYGESIVNDRNVAAADAAAAAVAEGRPRPNYREIVWKPVTLMELKGFIGILIWAGFDRSKKYPVELMWSRDPIFSRPVPTATMSVSRYKTLMRALRFDDWQARRRLENPTRGAPVTTLISRFDRNLRVYFTPGMFLTVDEMLIKFRGRAPFRVYLKTKPGRYGLKVWIIVDTKTSYILGFQLYEGKPASGRTERNLGRRVVTDLANPYYNTGRGITTDNFFTSLALVRELLANGLTLLGTIRKIRREVPRQLTTKQNRQSPSTIFVFNTENNAPVTLCSYKPEARKDVVLLLSSEHRDAAIPNAQDPANLQKKPAMVLDYNARKGGVDAADQLIAEYSCQRPAKRWPLKVFFTILDVAAINAYKLFVEQNPDFGRSRNNIPVRCRRLLGYKQLALQLVWPQICFRYLETPNLQRYIVGAMSAVGSSFGQNIPERPHPVPDPIPEPPPPQPGRRGHLGRCVLCTGLVRLRKLAYIRCSICNLPVCNDHRRTTHFCENCQDDPALPGNDGDDI